MLSRDVLYHNTNPATDKKHNVKGQQQFTITAQTKGRRDRRACVCVQMQSRSNLTLREESLPEHSSNQTKSKTAEDCTVIKNKIAFDKLSL